MWKSINQQSITLIYEFTFHLFTIFCVKILRNLHTVWKFHSYSICQILHEINFGYFRSAKSAIFTTLKALILIFVIFCTFWRHNSRRLTKFRASKVAKIGRFWSSGSRAKVISRKIFPHCADLTFFCKIEFLQFVPQCEKTRKVFVSRKNELISRSIFQNKNQNQSNNLTKNLSYPISSTRVSCWISNNKCHHIVHYLLII